ATRSVGRRAASTVAFLTPTSCQTVSSSTNPRVRTYCVGTCRSCGRLAWLTDAEEIKLSPRGHRLITGYATDYQPDGDSDRGVPPPCVYMVSSRTFWRCAHAAGHRGALSRGIACANRRNTH